MWTWRWEGEDVALGGWEEVGAVCESWWKGLRGRTRMRLAYTRAQE